MIKKVVKDQNVVIAMENTGRYNSNLFEYLSTKDFKIYVPNPLHLKKSIGLYRGKNDKIDSQRICSFIEKNYTDFKQWKPSNKTIDKLGSYILKEGIEQK